MEKLKIQQKSEKYCQLNSSTTFPRKKVDVSSKLFPCINTRVIFPAVTYQSKTTLSKLKTVSNNLLKQIKNQ